MRKILSSIAFLILTTTAFAQSWPTPPQEAKAGARWWWLGSAVDKGGGESFFRWLVRPFYDRMMDAPTIAIAASTEHARNLLILFFMVITPLGS